MLIQQQYRGTMRCLALAVLILNPGQGAQAAPAPDPGDAELARLARQLRSDGVAVARLGLATLEGRPAYVVQLNDRYQLPGLLVSVDLVEALRASRDAILAPDGRLILSAHALNRIQGAVVRTAREDASSIVRDANGRVRLD